MIQVKELRFGNKVYNQTGEVITVQQILFNTIVYDSQMKVSTAEAHDTHLLTQTSTMVEVIKEVDCQDVEPIPITPQVLQNSGFRCFKREEWIVSHKHGHIDFELTANGVRLRQPTPTTREIKYLHQLQNLFYALTGQDLVVNL